MRSKSPIALLASTLLFSACAEVREDPRDTSAPTDASADATPPRDSSSNPDAPAAPDAPAPPDAGPVRVVLNEVQATGAEFVELYNTGSAAANLEGLALTDTSQDGGVPNVAEALRFPAGTTIPSGGYLVIRTKVSNPMSGPQTDCPMLNVSTCFHASWGVSNSRGESVYLLGAGDAVLSQVSYPAMGAPTGQSYARLPNGTGDFAPARSTPGAANAAP